MRLQRAKSSKHVTYSVLQRRHPPQHYRSHRLPRRGLSRWSRTGGLRSFCLDVQTLNLAQLLV
jgi:hypothetical protein